MYPCVVVTMSQEDMILSQVSLYLTSISMSVWLVKLLNYFCKFKPICLFKPLRKRELSYFQSGGHNIRVQRKLLIK